MTTIKIIGETSQERIDKLKGLLKEELQSEKPSAAYVKDLTETIKRLEGNSND